MAEAKHTHTQKAKKNSGYIYIIDQCGSLYRSLALPSLPSFDFHHTCMCAHAREESIFSRVCCNGISSDSESDLGHPKSTLDNYCHMLH